MKATDGQQINREDDQYKLGRFTWFIGSICDIDDPLNLNRVKVCAYGYYEEEKNGGPSKDDLPWATVMMPVTSASIKGNGGNHHLEVDSWVVGFFRDGPSAQDPVVMGSIATQSRDGTDFFGNQKYKQDIPSTASTTNKVHHTKAGHKVEFENKDGDEKITVQHAKGAIITIDKDNNISIANSGTTSISSSGAITITSAVKTTIV